MEESTRASVEAKETKVTITFDRASEVKENLRMAVEQAQAIQSKLYGKEPADKAKSTAEATSPSSFFDKIFEELHILKSIAVDLKVMLENINEKL